MAQLRFDGRVALVTGAGAGLGLAYAELLAARGAQVVVNDLGVNHADGTGSDGSRAEQAAAHICATGGVAIPNSDSVTTAEGAATMVGAAIDAFGRLDIVINNAGLFVSTPFPAPTPEELQRQLAVHVHGAFNVTRSAWPHMTAAGYGRVVVTSSASIFGAPGTASYSAAKGGAFGLARALAAAGAPHGIKVNALLPSAFTPLAQVSRAAETADPIESRTNTLLRAELVAPVVAALVHEWCPVSGYSYIAGGGRVARIFLAETRGWFDAELTPESVVANWDTIEDETGYRIPVDTPSHRAETRALLRHRHFGEAGV